MQIGVDREIERREWDRQKENIKWATRYSLNKMLYIIYESFEVCEYHNKFMLKLKWKQEGEAWTKNPISSTNMISSYLFDFRIA